MIPKVKKVNLSQQLTDTMIELIESGTWSEGMKLPNEIELADSFSVSRNIMREAMKVLSSNGILESQTGKGTFVSAGAINNIYHLRFLQELRSDEAVVSAMESRVIIEPELAAQACRRATDEQIAELRKLTFIDRPASYLESNLNFHICLAELSGNPLLTNFLRSIISLLDASLYASVPSRIKDIGKSLEDHAKIVNAMEMRDPELVKYLVYCHLKERMDLLFRAKEKSGGKKQ